MLSDGNGDAKRNEPARVQGNSHPKSLISSDNSLLERLSSTLLRPMRNVGSACSRVVVRLVYSTYRSTRVPVQLPNSRHVALDRGSGVYLSTRSPIGKRSSALVLCRLAGSPLSRHNVSYCEARWLGTRIRSVTEFRSTP